MPLHKSTVEVEAVEAVVMANKGLMVVDHIQLRKQKEGDIVIGEEVEKVVMILVEIVLVAVLIVAAIKVMETHVVVGDKELLANVSVAL